MNKVIYVIKKTRTKLLEFIDDLHPEQLNQIPEGFNNNTKLNLNL